MTNLFDNPSFSTAASPKGGAEMRTAVRKAASLKVRVLLESGTILEGRTQDVSTGGVGLVLVQPLVPQSTVQVALQLPKLDGQSPYGGHVQFDVVTGSGKVIFQVLRGDNYQIGLQWLNLDSKMLGLIQTFVNHVPKPMPKI
jgi:PilZ domain